MHAREWAVTLPLAIFTVKPCPYVVKAAGQLPAVHGHLPTQTKCGVNY